jgi:hypothetical protein
MTIVRWVFIFIIHVVAECLVSRSSTGPLDNNISSQISNVFKNQNWWFFIDSNNYAILVQRVETCRERLALRVSLNSTSLNLVLNAQVCVYLMVHITKLQLQTTFPKPLYIWHSACIHRDPGHWKSWCLHWDSNIQLTMGIDPRWQIYPNVVQLVSK